MVYEDDFFEWPWPDDEEYRKLSKIIDTLDKIRKQEKRIKKILCM
ncbi:hypothetical protein J2128_000541 [Methanomicrobium sp. W14]|nr:hypothetical protein [Methanomicrobium sp. W14]MBP2132620.1 hypothetical protein [Methanomicrobium sp. W14]